MGQLRFEEICSNKSGARFQAERVVNIDLIGAIKSHGGGAKGYLKYETTKRRKNYFNFG